jgi:hypothetical protein
MINGKNQKEMMQTNRSIIRPVILTTKIIILLSLYVSANLYAGVERVRSDELFVWSEAAVNAVVLQYTYTGSNPNLSSETAEHLSILMYRSILYSIIKYSPVGAIQISMIGDERYDHPDTIFNKLIDLQPGANHVIKEDHALVFLWGHIYEEGDEIYVQSYLRFLRRGKHETLSLSLKDSSGNQYDFVGGLPSQTFAFAPRRLTKQDLDKITSEYQRNLLVREEPSFEAEGYPADSEKIMNFSYRILEAREDWMRIDPMGPGTSGWIYTGARLMEADIRTHMPEIYFAEAVAGYMRDRMVADHTFEGNVRAEWINRAIDSYEKASVHSSIYISSRRAAIPRSTAKVLQANTLLLENSPPSDNQISEALELYTEAVKLTPYNANALNLKTIVEIYQEYHSKWQTDNPMSFSSEFEYSLSLDPGNYYALANYESLYTYILSQPASDESESNKELEDKLLFIRNIRQAARQDIPIAQ